MPGKAMRNPIAFIQGRARANGRLQRPMRRRGVSVLEMTLVLPILLMLSVGIVDYGYFFYLKSTLQGAAQAGARASIVPGATNTSVSSAISSMMTASSLQNSGYTVTTSPADITTAASGATLTVTVTCNWGTAGYHSLPSVLGGISSSKSVTGAATMRKE